MDGAFLEGVRELRRAGTGARAWSLYSLVRTVRPTRLLEIGVGYTTLFLLRGMADNVAAARAERRRLAADAESGPGNGTDLLDPTFFTRPHEPRLLACDAHRGRMDEVVEVAGRLGLDGRLDVHVGDFRDLPVHLGDNAPLFDLVFFDCGGPPEYVDFLRDFWRRIEPRGGLLALDFTWWSRPVALADGTERTMKLPGSVLNEIERQRLERGAEARFETLTLVEPHKLRQGSLTLIRRLPPEATVRDTTLERDLDLLGAEPVDGSFELD